MTVSKLCVSVLLLCYVAAIQATYVGSGPADACGVQCYSDRQCIRSYGNQRCNKCQPVPYNQRFKCCCPANADCTYEDGEYGCECKRGYVQQGYECISKKILDFEVSLQIFL
ncbi:uncharacterized protein LOC143468585 [Clavelina lepadiformis]|uniref:uncharacterized protein LOC143468585 n=1 Tax=Clavelina lepadiformis TaxID=159417 RepID=UPI004041F5A2